MAYYVGSETKMLKPFLGIIPLILFCVGCGQNPLTTEVAGVPSTVNSWQKIRLQVIVHNRSNDPQSLPYQEIILRTTGLKFVPGDVPKNSTMGDYPINRVSLNICPPGFDWIEPKGERRYDFTWTPESEDSGLGAFFVSLPPTMPPIQPLPMTIINKRTQQGVTPQSATRSQFKFPT